MKIEPPYRLVPSKSEGEGELERLAAQGQQRASAQRLQSQKDDEPEIEARLLSAMELLPAPAPSLGTWLDTWIPRVFFLLGGLLFALSVLLDRGTTSAVLCAGGVVAVMVVALRQGLLSRRRLLNGVKHKARDRAVLITERAWPSSLPFALEGYFEILREYPLVSHVEAAITLRGDSRAPDLDVLQGIVLGVDVDAQVRVDSPGTVTILSGSKSCITGDRHVVTNREIPPYVHALVEKALLPLHRTHPIERVTLRRE